jgi:demethylmenaquinone methyltransferase/2-methoxy-6-polyprenyl-1,4-benzoquinol methylase
VSETKRERVRAMFGRIARGYDRLNTILSLGMHHGWRRIAVRQCELRPGGWGLDVATGTADFAIEMLGRGGRVIGVDPAEPMLAVGAEKLRRGGMADRVQLLVGEAERLPVASERFDCATIGFALRNVTDIDRTFAEMARAVRPGGRVVALEIARPRGALFRPIFLLYFYRISPRLARLFGGDAQAYQYLPDSLKTFQSREELADAMRRAGLADVRIHDLSGGSVCVHVGRKPDR